MSSIHLWGTRLIQGVKGHEEELGCIRHEPDANCYALWLKDSFGVASTASSYIRADEYPSLEVAKSKVLHAPSVFIWHLVWMRGVVKRESEKVLEEQWETLNADFANLPSKQNITDRLLAHLDRMPMERVKALFPLIGKKALEQTIIEIVKKFFF